jgi:NADH-quinone oxidoreductase subunit E
VNHFDAETEARARAVISLYPKARSALIPLCHLAQERDGWLRPEAIEDIAELLDLTAADVRGTATFYDMLHTEPVGTYVVAVCTNIACLLDGGAEMLEHAEERLGIRVGATTPDGRFTLEESECLADCDHPPCVQVNHRFVRTTTPEAFDGLIDDLVAGRRGEEIPPHGTLIRVRRDGGLRVDRATIARERAREEQARDARVAEGQG